jgi:adenylate cyclase
VRYTTLSAIRQCGDAMNQMRKALQDKLRSIADRLGQLPTKKVDIALAIVVTLIGLALYAFVVTGGYHGRTLFSFLDNIEQRTLDARFRLRGTRPIDDRIAIIGIDEKTLQKVGAWPIPRNAYAKLVDQLSAGGASIVAFDVTFPTPEKNSATEALKRLEAEIGTGSPAVIEKIREIERTSDNDQILADSMKKANNVVLGHIFLGRDRLQTADDKAADDYFNVLWGKPFPQIITRPEGAKLDTQAIWADVTQSGKDPWGIQFGIEPNIRLLAEAARSYGFFNVIPDGDGTVRRAPFLLRYQDKDFFPSLELQTLREYENIKDQSITAYIASDGFDSMELGPHRLKLARDARELINYAGPYHTYPHYSLADVIDGTVPASTFKSKIVFVGATAVGIGDLRITPFQEGDYMGVEIHANVIDNLLHSDERGRAFLSRGFAEEMIDIIFILIFGIGMGVLFARLKPLYSTFSVVAAIAVFGLIAYFAFAHFGMWLYTVIPVGTLVVNYGAITSFRMVTEEREKRKIRKTFERYVSPGVIRLIEKDPKRYFKQGGESKELTIMFSDIRDFTRMSEGMTPDELVSFLNEYLGEMTDITFKRWGTLDKYIGDAVMAFWGSPYPQEDHAIRACSAALDMMSRLEELNLKWEAEGKRHFEIGIGVNTGVVSVGNMGSGHRFAWTVMGDPVNLASRLEGQNKEYHSKIIIGENTYREVKDQFVCRDLDLIRVKGKLKPVKIYELLGWIKDQSRYADLLSRWSAAQAAYLQQDWNKSIALFEQLLATYPDDGPAHAFLKRAHEKRDEAPDPTWDGVFIAKSK